MKCNCQSISDVLKSCENDLMYNLHLHNLLNKFNKDVKKVIVYYMITEVNVLLKNKDIILCHDHKLSLDLELTMIYPDKELNNFINKLCSIIKKLTRRLIFITPNRERHLKQGFNEFDGEIVDEIILLRNQKPATYKQLKEFLDEYNLKELFNSLSVHLQ